SPVLAPDLGPGVPACRVRRLRADPRAVPSPRARPGVVRAAPRGRAIICLGDGPMQGYAQATLDKQEGSALWRAMHEEVRGRRLMTPSPGTVLLKLAILLPLLGAALALSWLGASWLELAAGYAALALLLAQFAFIG